MLEKLLAELRSGGTFETGELAARLGTTPEMLTAMLEHLQRSGAVHPFTACNDACTECSLSSSCRRPEAVCTGEKSLKLFTVEIP